ncbi:MAG: DNA polymerase III subunit alpha [Buchnera aphidicola (Tetraneura akinire)]
MINSQFVHLRVHSDYSLFDGIHKPKELVQNASKLGFPAIAITDLNNLFGIIKFYKISNKLGLKPIIGTDCTIQSSFLEGRNKFSKLTLLAKNNEGYRNLIILISKAYQNRYKNIGNDVFIKQEWLSKYNQGLIILSGGCFGDIGINLIKGNFNCFKKCISFYRKYFPDSFYIELNRLGFSNENKYLEIAINVALSKKIPVVATNFCCFLHKKDFYEHTIRVSINQGVSINDPCFLNKYTDNQYLKTNEEMNELFSDIPESIFNTLEIAKRCNVFLNLGHRFLPNFFTGKLSTKDFLVVKSKKGLEKRLRQNFPNKSIRSNIRHKYDERLSLELKVISSMGFSGYFLIVMEFIEWAKKKKIPVGPGRGSGAGSLVAYCLSITELDPLSFNLLFERFLNINRVSLPDFDIDFCMKQRDLVIEHVSNLYGKNSVSQIITFGTMTAKAVIRDVGRALGYNYGFMNSISKKIPLDPGITLKKAFSINSELLSIYNSDKNVKTVIDLSKKLEGVTRNVGKHAGGVVISPTEITNFSPLYFDEEGKNQITQFDKDDIESVGLVKFDFLGLKTLTIISYAVKMINKIKKAKKQPLLNINCINLNEIKCYDFLQTAETIGIFQLESKGMKNLINRLKPDSFEDLISLIALFRPGPLQSGMVDNFISRKHGLEEIFYPDKKWQHISLKPILKSTYGIILYQEQVMQIAQTLAGYTLSQADILRRAMGKKKPEEMIKQREIFKNGASKNNINSSLSIKIFDLLEKFSGYGFNKSHSAAYALLSYQTLWLKVNYPLEFFASILTEEMDNTKKLFLIIKEVNRMKINFLLPNINLSEYDFFVSKDKKIVFGLGMIKGIGKSVIFSILENRKKKGIFLDLFDLCIRIDHKKLTRIVLLKLIKSGVLDVFDIDREVLVNMLPKIIQSSRQYLIEKKTKQNIIFNISKEKIINKIKNEFVVSKNIIWTDLDKLIFEKDVFGFYLSSHPIYIYIKEIKFVFDICRISDVLKKRNKYICNIMGVIQQSKKRITTKNTIILTLMLDDNSSIIELIFFSDVYEKYKDFIVKDNVIIVNGYISCSYNNNFLNHRFVVRNLLDIQMFRNKYIKKCFIYLNEINTDLFFLKSLSKILKKHSFLGTTPICIKFNYLNNSLCSKFQLGTEWLINVTDLFLYEIKALCGEKNFYISYKKK